MNSDSFIRIGNLAFYGWKADVVGCSLIAGLFFGGVLFGYLIWGPK